MLAGVTLNVSSFGELLSGQHARETVGAASRRLSCRANLGHMVLLIKLRCRVHAGSLRDRNGNASEQVLAAQ